MGKNIVLAKAWHGTCYLDSSALLRRGHTHTYDVEGFGRLKKLVKPKNVDDSEGI